MLEVNDLTLNDNTKNGKSIMREVKQVGTSQLKPHPLNKEIYGQEDISEMITKIQTVGRILVPLVITENNVIISGHRRWEAAQALKPSYVPCEVISFSSDEEEKSALVLYNSNRTKTLEQRTREGMSLEKTISIDSFLIRLSNLKQNQTDMDESSTSEDDEIKTSANSEKKKIKLTRDKVAEAVGIKSGKTYERAKKVLERVDALRSEGNIEDADLFIIVLNRSASAAVDLLEVDLGKLTRDDRDGIKVGKIAPNVFKIPTDNKDNKVKADKKDDYRVLMKEVKSFGQTASKIKKSIPYIKSDAQKEKFKVEIAKQIEVLNSLLSAIEP